MADNLTLVMAVIVVTAILLTCVVIYLIRNVKTKRIKKILSDIEIEKNKIDSSPVIPELAKVEAYLHNEKLQVMYNEWSERLQNIRDTQIPKISDMILEAEYSLSQNDYKSAIYKVVKLEMELYKVKTKAEFLYGEVKEITSSEERSREIITEFKITFRNLHQKFQDTKEEFSSLAPIVQKQFESISKRFEDFETILDNNEYTEVNEVVKVIDDFLKHMTIVIDEIPSIVLLSYNVIPKRIEEIEEVYARMVKSGYPLEYLNVEYNIEEAQKKIGDILVRTKNLDLEDSLFELKVLLEYFDSTFSEFEKEKTARLKYEELNTTFKNKLEKNNSVVSDIFVQMDDIKSVYDLSEEDIEVLKTIDEELKELNKTYDMLPEENSSNGFAYSRLLKEVETLSVALIKLEDKLNNSLDAIGNMRDDEARARQQFDEIKMILKDSRFKMREYNLPFVPQSYYVELKEAAEALREIAKELDKKPITISVLNTRVDTARDLVIKLYTRTSEMLKTAIMAETAIIYGNRYRSNYEGLSTKLNGSEQLFLTGKYQESLELTINLLGKIEPGIYDRLVALHKLKETE